MPSPAQQLKDSAGNVSKTAVAYYLKSENTEIKSLRIQKALSYYLGMADSGLESSILNPNVADEHRPFKWQLYKSDGRPQTGEDAQIFYEFGLAFRDVVSPKDLETFQHYEDILFSDDPQTDSQLTILPEPNNITFTETVGARHITGVRKITGPTTVCWENLSADTRIVTSWLQEYLRFMNHGNVSRLSYFLNASNSSFQWGYNLIQLTTDRSGQTGCQLFLSFRKADQFPFSSRQLNGLYAREKSIRDSLGNTLNIPAVYINAANLEMNPANIETAGSKYVGLVLEHEFAHFLGMRHSPSTDSVLSAGGYNSNWQIPGADSDIINAFISKWR